MPKVMNICEIGMAEEDYDTEEDFETALEDAHDVFWRRLGMR